MKLEDMVLVSVDDHLVEPPHMFEGRLPKKLADRAPRLVHFKDNDTDAWVFEGKRIPNIGSNAVVGRQKHEYGFEPTALSQLRKGCWDVDARIDDMNVNGVAASLNFPSFVGMAGELFPRIEDKELALATLRAWNDWNLEDWCGRYPGRLMPLAITPYWDPELAAHEIRRVSAKGCHTISFPPNPIVLGFPSFHTDFWNPIWRACSDENVIVCIHFSDSSYCVPSPDSPVDVMNANMPIGLYRVASDIVYSPILRSFPDLRFALSEGGVGWVPYMMERMDFAYDHHSGWTRQNFGGLKPSDYFKKHFYTCFIDDPIGIMLREKAGIDRITFEVDYPHADCTWPKSPENLWVDLGGVSDEDIDKMTHLNAMRAFRFDLFSYAPREELSVGALREKGRDVDVRLLPAGRGKPPSDAAMGPVTMREVTRQLQGAFGS